MSTLPKTNIAPENGWLEYTFRFGKVYFQALGQFQGGSYKITWMSSWEDVKNNG